jgi:hypothetical protein
MNLTEMVARELADEFCKGYEMAYSDYNDSVSIDLDYYVEENWKDFASKAETIVDYLLSEYEKDKRR